jgi:1-deoxy-D-xylulose-5-phosphate synthase
MSPKDENELQHMLYTAVNYQGPVAVRYPRGEGYGVDLDQELTLIPIGQAEYLRQGEDILIIAIGSMVYPALEAVKSLANRGIKASLINARFVKPLDKGLLLEEINRHSNIITVEEQVLAGGFGSAVLELMNEHGIQNKCFKRIGLPDRFISHGTQQGLRSIYQLDSNAIFETALEMLNINTEVGT